jgi:hypothetical protein
MSSSNKPDLRIDWAMHEAAKYACEHWHYSKCIPKSKLVKVGAWENEKFIGVVIFGYGATSTLGSPYGLTMLDCCELVRIALTNHKSPVSRILRLALLFLRKKCPQIKLIISFADTSQNHHGGIYQASNWIYTGKTQPTTCWEDPKGKLWHGRRASPSPNKQKQLVTSEWTKVVQPGKHRYLMPLDDEMRARIMPLAQPYPKRPKQATPATSGEAAGQNRPGRSNIPTAGTDEPA